MMLKVTDVEYMGNYALLCRFNNGLQRYVDMEPLLKYPMYAELKDKEQFRQFVFINREGLDNKIIKKVFTNL